MALSAALIHVQLKDDATEIACITNMRLGSMYDFYYM